MTIDVIRGVLLWCSVINMGLFFLTFLAFTLADDWIYRFHGRWYDISKDKFNAIFYASMIFYKTFILFFNIVPYIALRIAG